MQIDMIDVVFEARRWKKLLLWHSFRSNMFSMNTDTKGQLIWCTPWKINIEHNTGGLEDDFPSQMGDF